MWDSVQTYKQGFRAKFIYQKIEIFQSKKLQDLFLFPPLSQRLLWRAIPLCDTMSSHLPIVITSHEADFFYRSHPNSVVLRVSLLICSTNHMNPFLYVGMSAVYWNELYIFITFCLELFIKKVCIPWFGS